MVAVAALVHHANMAKGRKGPGHFLRQWRKSLDLTLEAVAERVELLSASRSIDDPDLRPISMTHATLSRIERGKIPYNQHLLELLAEIYQTDPASLIIRDPSDPDPLWSIYDTLQPVERRQVVEMAKVLKRTGTTD